VKLNLLALVAWGCLAGCSRDEVVVFPLVDTANPGDPEVWISPNRMSFDASTEPQYQTFSVTNVGDAPLEIIDLTLEGHTGFALLGDAPPGRLAPGTGTEMVVEYTSGEAWSSASIWLQTDDPLNPIEQLFLEGLPIAPTLWLTPSEFDFAELTLEDALTPGCELEKDLVLINQGKADLEIWNLQYSTNNQWLRISQAPELPLVLAPREATTVTVSFAPEGEGEDAATLLVFSNDPEAVATATQRGSAAWEWVHLEGFELLPVDLVLALEQSSSMTPTINTLKHNTDLLVGALNKAGLDWKASVVARDNACHNAGPIGPTTHDPGGALGLGLSDYDTLHYTDQLLAMLHISILRADEGDCNEGMIREDSVLHAVVISNQAHQGPEDALYYVEELRDLLSSDERLVVSAIAGDVPAGCTGADPGMGLDEAVAATDGAFLSICNELHQLSRLADASRRAVVRLPSPADPATLSVRVDGVGWTDGWRLDPIDDLLVFETQPEPGDTVEVDYGVLSCD